MFACRRGHDTVLIENAGKHEANREGSANAGAVYVPAIADTAECETGIVVACDRGGQLSRDPGERTTLYRKGYELWLSACDFGNPEACMMASRSSDWLRASRAALVAMTRGEAECLSRARAQDAARHAVSGAPGSHSRLTPDSQPTNRPST